MEKRIRKWQDAIRDHHWRIKNIPWQEDGRPEYIYNTHLTLFTGLGGALLFVVSSLLVASGIFPFRLLVVAVLGLLIIVLGRIYAAWHKYRKWQQVRATCLDRELKEYEAPSRISRHRTHKRWTYRLLCQFWHNGKHYTVTPTTTHIITFNSQKGLEKYLYKRIGSDNTCTLWFNPENPLQCCFDKRPKI